MSATIERVTPHSGGLDRLVRSVQKRLLVVIGVSILFGAALWIVAMKSTPIYRGTTILAPADIDKKSMGSGLSSALGSVGGFAALAGLGLGGSDYATEEAVAVLKSQQLTEQFIQDNNLLPELFPKLWDPAAGAWRPGKKPPTLGAGFRAFNKIRKVQRDSKSGLITVQVDWKDPVKAANFANGLVERLNDEMRHRALAQAEASVGYLQSEMAGTVDVSTHEAISRLMEEQVKQEMLAHVTKQYALQIVDSAMPADLDAPIRPIKILYLAFGLFLGAAVGSWIAMLLEKKSGPSEK